jgi:hypothetical protein
VNTTIMLIVSRLIGWIANMIMRTNVQQGAVVNIVVGIVGALLGDARVDHRHDDTAPHRTGRVGPDLSMARPDLSPADLLQPKEVCTEVIVAEAPQDNGAEQEPRQKLRPMS